MRILHVVTAMGRGGLETMIMNVYRRMDRSRIQFDFLVHRAERADYEDEINRLGGRIYRLARLNPFSRRYLRSLHAFFAAHPEYRVVHVHQDCMSAVILKAAKAQGVPVRIAHSHNSSQDKNLKYPIKLLCRRQIPRYATALLACSRAAGDWMFIGAPYTVVRNAIDTAQYRYDAARAARVRSSLHIAEDALVVGHVGRFSPAKNHGFLLDAFGELHRQNPRAVLLLVGDGPLRRRMERRVRRKGLAGCVRFLGVRSDVCDLMQAMDVFVFPSLYEGLPVALVEAQAAGLPCVISEGVPGEGVLTDGVQRASLREGAKAWARRMLTARTAARRGQDDALAARGFDIAQSAAWLAQYYYDQKKEKE